VKAILVALFAALFIGVATTFASKGSSGSGNTGNAPSSNPVQQPSVPNEIGGLFSQAIQTFAWGISLSEGFGPPNNLPTRANNPGDLTTGDSWGYNTLGTANAEGVLIFTPNTLDGWYALYKKLYNIASGQSHVYSLSMDFYDFAVQYTGENDNNSNNWAENLASACGVPPTSLIGDFFNA
jgi:hypothetical protein